MCAFSAAADKKREIRDAPPLLWNMWIPSNPWDTKYPNPYYTSIQRGILAKSDFGRFVKPAPCLPFRACLSAVNGVSFSPRPPCMRLCRDSVSLSYRSHMARSCPSTITRFGLYAWPFFALLAPSLRSRFRVVHTRRTVHDNAVHSHQLVRHIRSQFTQCVYFQATM